MTKSVLNFVYWNQILNKDKIKYFIFCILKLNKDILFLLFYGSNIVLVYDTLEKYPAVKRDSLRTNVLEYWFGFMVYQPL